MTRIKVHGHPLSSATRRVLLCLEEKGLEYEFVFVNLSINEHAEEPFITLNPFAQVPGFEDGDLELFESRAITRYISHAYANKGTPLIFDDPKKMETIGVWLEVEALRFNTIAQPLNLEIVIKPIRGWKTDEALVDELQGPLPAVLDVYEARLAKSKYLGGDEFSLVDLHHIPIINNLMKTKFKAMFVARPHVSDSALGLTISWPGPLGRRFLQSRVFSSCDELHFDAWIVVLVFISVCLVAFVFIILSVLFDVSGLFIRA